MNTDIKSAINDRIQVYDPSVENRALAEKVLELLKGKSVSDIRLMWEFFVMPKVEERSIMR